MPSYAVPRKVRDFILYYYAKLVIAPSAGQEGNYRFIIDRYRRLKNGEIYISDYDREIQQLAQKRGRCAFCGRPAGDRPVHVIPPHQGGPIGIHNLVYACETCATSKGNLGLIEWWRDVLGKDPDDLPRIPTGLFLKMAYEKHQVRFTLDCPCHDISEIWDGAKE